MSEYIYGSREKIKPPCKDCPDRHPHCHSECEAYLAYDADRQRIRKEKKGQFGYVVGFAQEGRSKMEVVLMGLFLAVMTVAMVIIYFDFKD